MYKLKPVFQSYFDQHQRECIKYLCKNPSDGAMVLIDGSEHIEWYVLSANPSDIAIKILKQTPDKINWSEFSTNPSDKALDMVEARTVQQTHWSSLSVNHNIRAIRMIQATRKYVGSCITMNPNKDAIDMLQPTTSHTYWYFLSANTSDYAMDILEKNKDNINWRRLASNSNNRAVKLIEENPGYIEKYWDTLLLNPRAIEIIKSRRDQIDWKIFNRNPQSVSWLEESPFNIMPVVFQHTEIFEVDLEWIRKTRFKLHQELLRVVMHPDNYDYFKQLDL